MKKMIAVLLAVLLLFSLAACGEDEPAPSSSAPVSSEPTSSMESLSTEAEQCAAYAIEKLKGVLKNPASLLINNLYAVETGESYIIAIDYSAENSFGGSERENLFLEVMKIPDGFGVKTYGTGSFIDADNQMYTAQVCAKYKKEIGYYLLDTETLRITAFVVGEGPDEPETVEFQGKLKGVNTSYEGAWNVKIGDDDYLKVVYFKEGEDLSWYEQFTGNPYEVTISAVLEDGKYYDATIVADPVLDATHEERLARFNWHDRGYYDVYTDGLTQVTGDGIAVVLSGNSFTTRSNFGEKPVSFLADGSVDSKYTANGTEFSMYEAWRVEGDTVILTRVFNGKTTEYSQLLYKYNDSTYVLICNDDGICDCSIALFVG